MIPTNPNNINPYYSVPQPNADGQLPLINSQPPIPSVNMQELAENVVKDWENTFKDLSIKAYQCLYLKSAPFINSIKNYLENHPEMILAENLPTVLFEVENLASQLYLMPHVSKSFRTHIQKFWQQRNQTIPTNANTPHYTQYSSQSDNPTNSRHQPLIGSNIPETIPFHSHEDSNAIPYLPNYADQNQLPQDTNEPNTDFNEPHLTTLNPQSDIPSSPYRLRNIQVLNLSNSKLKNLPLEIRNLEVHVLNLSHNNFETCPPEIERFRDLRSLVLSHNHLKTFPLNLGHFENFTALNLANNQFETFPLEIGQLRELHILNLAHNQLGTCPPEIGQLRELHSLVLSYNQLETCPPEIGQLSKLKYLFVRPNKLKELPKETTSLTNLESISTHNNQLDNTSGSTENQTIQNPQQPFQYGLPNIGPVINEPNSTHPNPQGQIPSPPLNPNYIEITNPPATDYQGFFPNSHLSAYPPQSHTYDQPTIPYPGQHPHSSSNKRPYDQITNPTNSPQGPRQWRRYTEET